MGSADDADPAAADSPTVGDPGPAPVVTYPTSIKAHLLGHSLMSKQADFLSYFASQTPGIDFEFKEQNVPGASLQFQLQVMRENTFVEYTPFDGAFDDVFGSESFDHFVMVESVPRGDVVQTLMDAQELVDMALAARPAARTFFYEPWHCINSGTDAGCAWDNGSATRNRRWVDRVAADGDMWRDVVRQINSAMPASAEPMRFVPAATALAEAVTEARAGRVPGFSDIADFFIDDIHPNAYGLYVVACVHYAVLYGRAPVGQPVNVTGRWGDPEFGGSDRPAPLTAQSARALQQIAWDVARAEPLTGVP